MTFAGDRWSEGKDHRPEVLTLLMVLNDLDTEGELELRYGGDGDPGETLAYYLDELIENHGWHIMTPMFPDAKPHDPSIPQEPIFTPEEFAKGIAILQAGGMYEYQQEQKIKALEGRIEDLERELCDLRGNDEQ